MKKAACALLPFLLVACAPKKDAVAPISGQHTVQSPCPEDGECKFEMLKDKSLDITIDGTGMPYYTLTDVPGKVVIRYTYDFIVPKDVEDAGYTETIIFETDSGFSSLHKADPKDVKMLFGVQCFCRGKAGYYKVEEGEISYEDGKLAVTVPNDIVEGQRTFSYKVALK